MSFSTYVRYFPWSNKVFNHSTVDILEPAVPDCLNDNFKINYNGPSFDTWLDFYLSVAFQASFLLFRVGRQGKAFRKDDLPLSAQWIKSWSNHQSDLDPDIEQFLQYTTSSTF